MTRTWWNPVLCGTRMASGARGRHHGQVVPVVRSGPQTMSGLGASRTADALV